MNRCDADRHSTADTRSSREKAYHACVNDNFTTACNNHVAFSYVPVETLVNRVRFVSKEWKRAVMHASLFRDYVFDLGLLLGYHINMRFYMSDEEEAALVKGRFRLYARDKNDDDNVEKENAEEEDGDDDEEDGVTHYRRTLPPWLPLIHTLCISDVQYHSAMKLVMDMLTDPTMRGRSPHLTTVLVDLTYDHTHVYTHPLTFAYLDTVRTLHVGMLKHAYFASYLPRLRNMDVNVCPINAVSDYDKYITHASNAPYHCRRLRYARLRPFDKRPTVAWTTARLITMLRRIPELRSVAFLEPDVIWSKLLGELLRLPNQLESISLRLFSVPVAKLADMYVRRSCEKAFVRDSSTQVNLALRTLDLGGFFEKLSRSKCTDVYSSDIMQWLILMFPRLTCLYMNTLWDHTLAWTHQLLAMHPTLRVVVLNDPCPPVHAVASWPPASLSPPLPLCQSTRAIPANNELLPPSNARSRVVLPGNQDGVYLNAVGSWPIRNGAYTRHDPPPDDLLLTILEHLQFVTDSQIRYEDRHLPGLVFALVWRVGDADALREPVPLPP